MNESHQLSDTSEEDANGSLATEFRRLMAAVSTPVAVVTTLHKEMPYGTTVSAFTSQSKVPPMVLVSLDRSSKLLSLIHASGKFGINILGFHQSDLAQTFARKNVTDKFANVDWEIANGVPRLPGSAGWLTCDVHKMIAGGDHVIILGDVSTVDKAAVPPLTYHDRMFGTHTPLDAVFLPDPGASSRRGSRYRSRFGWPPAFGSEVHDERHRRG